MKLKQSTAQEMPLTHNLHVGHIYEHYKGDRYKILAIARHTSDLSWLVVYECLYQNPISQIWIRPLDQFIEVIMLKGVSTPRFTYIGEK